MAIVVTNSIRDSITAIDIRPFCANFYSSNKLYYLRKFVICVNKSYFKPFNRPDVTLLKSMNLLHSS